MLLISGCERSEHIKRVYKGGILPLDECRDDMNLMFTPR